MKLNGGTQHSPCLLLAGPRGASMEPMEHTAPRLHHSLLLSTSYNISQSALSCTVDDSDGPNFFSHTVKGLRRGFDSPNGGEHYTKPDLHTGLAQCRHFFTSAASASSLGTHLVRSAKNLQPRKNGKRFRKVPAPFPNTPPTARCPVSQKTCPKCPFDWIPFAET